MSVIERIIDQRRHALSPGFEVGRVLPLREQRMVGPFIFFDHMGPAKLDAGIPRSMDVRPHPHIGLSTVTYLYDGAMTHRDSLGIQQEIRPGEVNWMVAGRGITHSERLEYARANGALMHGIQSWVALPDEAEEADPAFYHHAGDDLPRWNESGLNGQLIAGALDGLKAGVKTHSPLFYVHWEMDAGTRHALPPEYAERAIYVAAGEVEVDHQTLVNGQMAVLAAGQSVTVTAKTPAIVMGLGGEPVGERFINWNFVSSSRERIEQARADWQAGRMKLPDGDDQEFTPLPETK